MTVVLVDARGVPYLCSTDETDELFLLLALGSVLPAAPAVPASSPVVSAPLRHHGASSCPR